MMGNADIQTAMLEMRRNGATYKQIAAEFHYTPNGVLYILRKTPNTHKIQQTAEMVEMYQNGFSSVKIAKKFGMSTSAVSHRLHRAGCKVNRCKFEKHYDKMVKLYYDGLTAEQIAEKIGCGHTNVLRILKLRGITPRRTDSNLLINAKIKELYENGATIAEIGRQLNMKRNTVDYRLCKMGCKAARISQNRGE